MISSRPVASEPTLMIPNNFFCIWNLTPYLKKISNLILYNLHFGALTRLYILSVDIPVILDSSTIFRGLLHNRKLILCLRIYWVRNIKKLEALYENEMQDLRPTEYYVFLI